MWRQRKQKRREYFDEYTQDSILLHLIEFLLASPEEATGIFWRDKHFYVKRLEIEHFRNKFQGVLRKTNRP